MKPHKAVRLDQMGSSDRAAHDADPRGVDLVVAPLALCAQMTPGGVCNTSAANAVVGADGVTRYAVGSTSALGVQAGEPMVCAAV
jgi:hypothetical protein